MNEYNGEIVRVGDEVRINPEWLGQFEKIVTEKRLFVRTVNPSATESTKIVWASLVDERGTKILGRIEKGRSRVSLFPIFWFRRIGQGWTIMMDGVHGNIRNRSFLERSKERVAPLQEERRTERQLSTKNWYRL